MTVIWTPPGCDGRLRMKVDPSRNPTWQLAKVGGVSRLSTNPVIQMRSRHVSAECSNVWNYDVILKEYKRGCVFELGALLSWSPQ